MYIPVYSKVATTDAATPTMCDLSQFLDSLYSDNSTTLLGCCPRDAIICLYVTLSPSPSYHDWPSHLLSWHAVVCAVYSKVATTNNANPLLPALGQYHHK